MAYLDTAKPTHKPGAIVSVVAIHAAVGALLVTGLGVTIMDRGDKPRIEARNIPLPVPPPQPTPTMEVDPQVTPKSAPDIYIPEARIPISSTGPRIDAADTPNFGETAPIPIPSATPGRVILPKIEPLPSPKVREAVGARPRGNTNWVTQGDYRNNWIRREMTGTVAFTVTVGTGGRVKDCTVTRSSGHTALDDATCKLVAQRARFDPARNTQDNKVAGSYSGSVLWQLPD